MIGRVDSERIDFVIDRFEEEWSSNSADQISELLSTFGLTNNWDAVTELIRIDIELRYQARHAVDLEDYFSRFPSLRQQSKHVAEIAFEDFRGRSDSGLDVPISRWRSLPGVKDAHWYRKLADDAGNARAESRIAKLKERRDDPDSAFDLALAEAGFTLVHEIGRGAFSHVYLATQTELADRFVVLKVVSQTLSEPQSMAMMLHTNIVPIYSFHRIANRSILCMPYAGSVTLHDFLRSRDTAQGRNGQSLINTVQAKINDTKTLLDDDESELELDTLAPAADEFALMNPLEQLSGLCCSKLATNLFEKMAAGLAHSHLRGILHGDLKPANVLVRNDGEPALLDFNLSMSLQGKRRTHLGGTLAYMSPENLLAFMGNDESVGPQSDIYSLGMILHEFVVGGLPYPAPASTAPVDLDPAVRIRKTPVEISNNDVPPGLKAIVKRCLAFSPADRYATADQLQQDLECERDGLPLVHAVEPRINRMKKWFRRHPKVTSSGTVGAVLAALLIPLGLFAKASVERSQNLKASMTFADFSNESERVLSQVVAEPNKAIESRIDIAMQPLIDFEVLKRPGAQAFAAPKQSPEHLQSVRSILLTHICHICYLESLRLRVRKNLGQIESSDYVLLDQLIERAEKLTGELNDKNSSRAIAFIKSRRARLVGNLDDADTLVQLANEMPLSSPTEAYLEGLRLLFNNRHDLALEILTPLVADDRIPSQLAWTTLARSQYMDHKYEDAKISYTQVINRYPESAHFLVRRGLCYLRTGQRQKGHHDIARAIELEPGSVSALAARARIYMVSGKFEEAVADYTTMLRISPENAFLLVKRADVYQKMGKADLAKKDLQAAYAVDDASSQSLVARALARDDDPDAAMEDLMQALRLSPDTPSIVMHMAYVSARKKLDFEEAARFYSKVLDMQPQNQVALIDRAINFARLKQFDKAEADLRLATSENCSARTLYQAACVSALMPERKNHTEGLRFLSQSLRAGYDAKRLRTDPDLETLRVMDGFRGILRMYQLSKTALPSDAER